MLWSEPADNPRAEPTGWQLPDAAGVEAALSRYEKAAAATAEQSRRTEEKSNGGWGGRIRF